MGLSKTKIHIVVLALALTVAGLWSLYRPWLDVLWAYPVAILCIATAFGAMRLKPWAATFSYTSGAMLAVGWVLAVWIYRESQDPFGIPILEGAFVTVGLIAIIPYVIYVARKHLPSRRQPPN